MAAGKFSPDKISLAFFDFEATSSRGYNNEGQLHDVLLVLAYESVASGIFSRITLARDGFVHPRVNQIENAYYTYDYLKESKLPNLLEVDRKKNPHKRNLSLDQNHYSLPSVVEDADFETQNLLHWQNYEDNLKKYWSCASPQLRKSSCFKFICFIYNQRFKYFTFLSLYGAAFDMQVGGQPIHTFNFYFFPSSIFCIVASNYPFLFKSWPPEVSYCV